ncbi:transcriptional regulator, XRE family [Aliarcobacter faecis]|uniref:helix-turn-helix domain-containing protein n=1 Tax=Aliarcobacter faecis TaxID=1564138 RepID=UPI00047B4BDA|nr:helix-turn-helix transcriptional regulator [Aliarcobacter faecis]QKF73767.1 transcriptional regulator, XRE family [Aliarcobacter faecis]
MTKYDFSGEEIEEFYKIVGKNVRKYRLLRGLTQLDLSFEMGNKSVSLVSACEPCTNGKHFNIEHLYKISKILDIKIEKFFEINDN